MGWGDSPGGLKTAGLIGLYWSPPYLHDGGAAVGPDPSRHLGLPGTLLASPQVPPDPANSLRAVVDRELRGRVVEANRSDPNLLEMNVGGVGHEYWVDQPAGFSPEDQDALVKYLLTYRP